MVGIAKNCLLQVVKSYSVLVIIVFVVVFCFCCDVFWGLDGLSLGILYSMRQKLLLSANSIILASQRFDLVPGFLRVYLLCWYLCVGDDAASPGEGEEPSDGDEEQQEGGDNIVDEQDGEEKPPSPVSSKQ